MTLKRVEIEDRKYPPRTTKFRGIDVAGMIRSKYPKGIVDFYQSVAERDLNRYREMETEPALWLSEGIDDVVNNYLKTHKITKENLHSIETKSPSMIGMSSRAIIIYESDEND